MHQDNKWENMLIINSTSFPIPIGSVVVLKRPSPDINIGHYPQQPLLVLPVTSHRQSARVTEVSVHHSIAEQAGLVTRDNIVMTLIPEPSTEAEIALEFVELSFVGQAMQRPEMWRFQDQNRGLLLYINQKVKTGVYCCHVNGEKHA